MALFFVRHVCLSFGTRSTVTRSLLAVVSIFALAVTLHFYKLLVSSDPTDLADLSALSGLSFEQQVRKLHNAPRIDVAWSSNWTVAQLEEAYFSQLTQDELHCSISRRLGGKDDGGWHLCLEPSVLPSSPCLAYSFGIGNAWGYDLVLADKIGCQVHAFDYSLRHLPIHKQLSKRLWFHRIGIAEKSGVGVRGWKVQSLAELIRQHGHETYEMDVLKLDVEGAEWDALAAALEQGVLRRVRQLLFESHTRESVGPSQSVTTKEDYIRYLRVWRSLYIAGFRQWFHHWNSFGNFVSQITFRQRTCCYEHYLVNINLLRSAKKSVGSVT